MAIAVEHLGKSFGSPAQEVLRDLSFRIEDGEFVSITGRSGSGKSTLLYVISSLDPATQGRVVIDGQNIETMDETTLHRFRNEKMGFIFQSYYLLPELTALENVLMPARRTHSEKTRRQRARDLLEQFGIGDKANHRPGQMSGGEQQRVSVARALLMQPRYLFADEPTGNLDSVNGDLVMKILKEASREHGTSVIMVTHDPDYAALADRQIRLVDGRMG